MRRRYVLGVVFVGVAALAALVLAEVLATAFLAVTVAYLLWPLRVELVDRGVAPYWASVLTALVGLVGALALLAPLGAVVFLRRSSLFDLLASVPTRVTVELFGVTAVVTLEQLLATLRTTLRAVVRTVAVALPVLAVKFTLFAFVVLALLQGGRAARRAVLGVVPPAYRDVAVAFHERIRATLVGIYVLQAVTALATFLLAAPAFALLGYDAPVAMGVVAATFQFLPIVGPSVLVLAVATYHVALGDAAAAAAMAAVGLVVVAWLPDVLVRPWLAPGTADLRGSLYFVGFAGGLLTLGAVGVVAGPLVVALLVEATALLSAERNHVDVEG
jgi:predicted PurR-regulated permease PerM